MNLTKLIAEAIKKADNSYFYENYTKQAKSVINELNKNGYVLAHKKPTEKMVKSGVQAILLGLVDAKEVAKAVYNDMLEADE